MNEAEAYADEENAQPSGDQPTYQWGDEEYATRTACEDAIAAALASHPRRQQGHPHHGAGLCAAQPQDRRLTMYNTATITPAWLPALKHVPDRWYVQSARSPDSSMLSIAFDQANAERIVADLHARGYRARVVRERVTREIMEA